MLFANERLNFFRPLTGKYREQIVACLRELYSRLYTSLADYSRVIGRELVLEVFQEAITRSPVLDDAEDDKSPSVRDDREQAIWILKTLIEHGWIELHADEISLTSTYSFSRIGRVFTQPMAELTGGRFRTRHRNTRNTCNALRSFLEKDKREVYDLLDAYEYSERIVADFSDVIAELDERKRQLVREVEAQQLVHRASDEFFEFMEKRFMPDLAQRFSEDSVVKYREELDDLLKRARAQRKETKIEAERELRRVAPELSAHGARSIYMTILDQIESRLHSAADLMLPALRRSLHGFTRRADILLRQLSFSEASQHALLEAFESLAGLSEAEQDVRLGAASEHLTGIDMGFVDPDHLRLQNSDRKRRVDTRAEVPAVDDPAARRRLFVEQALERAFAMNNRQLYDYLVATLAGGHEVRTTALPVRDARELLYAAHALEVGAAGWEGMGFKFEVLETGRRAATEFYLGSDEFVVRLIEERIHAAQ
jgi:hypothetical protein